MPALVAALTIGGLVVAGALGRSAPGEPGAESPGATSRQAAVAGASGSAPPTGEATTRPAAPLLVLDVRPHGGLVFVDADVFTRDAVVVIVSLADAAENVVDVRSVDMPGGSTALRTGPNDRFQLAFELAPVDAVWWVRATAYDRLGRPIASAREAVVPAFDRERSRLGDGS